MSLFSQPYYICPHCLNNQSQIVGDGNCIMCGHWLVEEGKGKRFAKIVLREGQDSYFGRIIEGSWYLFTLIGRGPNGESFYSSCDPKYPRGLGRIISEKDLEFYDRYKYLRRIG